MKYNCKNTDCKNMGEAKDRDEILAMGKLCDKCHSEQQTNSLKRVPQKRLKRNKGKRNG